MSDQYSPIETKEFNPADLENLVRFCVQELQSRPRHALPPPGAFEGAGIYALYYDGEFPLYQHPAVRSSEGVQPIYVGRARRTKSSGSRPLFRRLSEHAGSISAAANLRLEDFTCRFLLLHPVWVSTVEDLLISHFDTLWNGAIKGFGVHDPGGKRHGGEVPIWDTLHPGRAHARTMVEKGASLPELGEIESAIVEFQRRRTQSQVRLVTQEEARLILRDMLPEDDDN